MRDQEGFATMMDELLIRRTTDRPELLSGAYLYVLIVNARNINACPVENSDPFRKLTIQFRIGMAYTNNWTGGPRRGDVVTRAICFSQNWEDWEPSI